MIKRCKRNIIAVAMLMVLTAIMPSAVLAKEEAKTKSAAPAPASQLNLAPSARSAILMDQGTGTIIYEKNSNDKLPPASITKVMTMLLVMEALDEGVIKLTDKVKTSEYAASMGGSQIFLEPGEEMTVDEMLKGIALASGNDASVALAEKIAGTEAEFVKLMNKRAAELGMKNTNFVNCNGLPAENHYTSARDIAIMSMELLKHSEITKYTGLYQDYLRKSSEKPFWLVNTNKLVRFYTGADGLKTGFTSEAKFCLTATAQRDGLRVIAVVMGEPNTKTRNAEVTQMFDYSFAQYMNYPIFKEGDTMGTVKVEKGELPEMQLTAKHPYNVLLKKGGAVNDIRHELHIEPLKAPIKVNQPIGKLIVYQNNQVITEFSVDAPMSIEKAGWWTLLKRVSRNLFQ
ncbi:D-alanyl-D-alanine carboxypeptidase family protein [Paenibacillus sp. GCM10027626]|uniref:D-alanyl-D-alanine carboxypeptidase family protein n=1 Tax=Paenibacillus sp. GCM10027626 TaxID=3273411 RepID=UPI00362AA3F9